jgi:hypothetical protein
MQLWEFFGQMYSWTQWVVGLALTLLLTACSSVAPGSALVEQAIALELGQVQQELSQQLRLDAQPGQIQINQVTIRSEQPLTIQQLQAYRVNGTYDYTFKTPTRQVKQRQIPFEVYLQRQQEGKTWRMARLTPDENGEAVWVTQQLPYEAK